MPLNPNSRRPPPTPPDDETPPPVPFRPHAQRNAAPAVKKNPPSPPENSPPALPQRPNRNNPLPATPVAPTQDEFYEDISAAPPTIVKLPSRPKPTSKTATSTSHLSGADSMQKKISPPSTTTKPKVMIRTWDSFKEVGHKLFKHSDEPTAQNKKKVSEGKEEKKRRVTVGAMNSPEPKMLEEDSEPTDYEIPFQLDGDSDSSTRFNQQRSDSPISLSVLTDTQDPGDEIYEIAQDNQQQDDDEDYTAPDPLTPDVPPPQSDRKLSKGMLSLNTADLQMTRMKLTNTSNTLLKSPPASNDKNTASASTSTAGSNSVSAVSKMFQDKKLLGTDKPSPPPKPKPAGRKPLSSTTAADTTTKTNSNTLFSKKSHTADVNTSNNSEPNTVMKDNDKLKRDSRSDENASAGSVSSAKGTNAMSETKKKEKTAMLPKTATPPPKAKSEKPTCTSPKKPDRVPQPNPIDDGGEDIYDEGESENLFAFRWFHGDIDRKEGDRRISSLEEIGAFLIRTSSGSSKAPDGKKYPYTLVIKTKEEVKNLRIRQRSDGCFAIGTNERADEVSFSNLHELVDHHRENNVKIFRQDEDDQQAQVIKLTVSPKKP